MNWKQWRISLDILPHLQHVPMPNCYPTSYPHLLTGSHRPWLTQLIQHKLTPHRSGRAPHTLPWPSDPPCTQPGAGGQSLSCCCPTPNTWSFLFINIQLLSFINSQLNLLLLPDCLNMIWYLITFCLWSYVSVFNSTWEGVRIKMYIYSILQGKTQGHVFCLW